MRPGLALGCSLVFDRARAKHVILYPEGVLELDEPAAAILSRCDGRTVAEVVESLSSDYEGVTSSSVLRLLDDLIAQRVVADGGRPAFPRVVGGPAELPPGAPIGLIAEVTHRCPLQCGYCSNPIALQPRELPTESWLSVLDQAADLGVRQLHLTGGEPLLRRDLATLVGRAHHHGIYTNLITSGLGLSAARLSALVDQGLRHVQLSLQDSDPLSAHQIAGLADRNSHSAVDGAGRSHSAVDGGGRPQSAVDGAGRPHSAVDGAGRFPASRAPRLNDRKRAAAAAVSAAGLPLTVNVVLHAANIARVAEIAELAVSLGASRLELAHTQFYGWALRNRAALLPTPAQVVAADRAAAEAARLLPITYVRPDYLTGAPKPCMQGWAARQLAITPAGDALPCLAAAQLPGPPPPSVEDSPLSEIWYSSDLFTRYRGTDWLPSPCRECALREVDFGGCRCQAYQLTGDPAATDPACRLSPHHHLVTALRTPDSGATGSPPALVPRRFP
jgi:pyrroloquinoline quinone biosynthesis protein E